MFVVGKFIFCVLVLSTWHMAHNASLDIDIYHICGLEGCERVEFNVHSSSSVSVKFHSLVIRLL